MLLPNRSEIRHLIAGDKHSYELKLGPNQFAQILIDQKGVDVDVTATAPDGSLYNTMDSPNGFYGRETLSIVAQQNGNYRIVVSSEKGFPSGQYELRVLEPRTTLPADELRVTAERLFMEGQKLRVAARGFQKPQDEEKYNDAIAKYSEAFAIWRELGELRGQGYALSGMGRSYKAIGQFAQALDFLGQALSRLEEADDLPGQAFVLNETGAAHRDLGDGRDALISYQTALNLRIKIGDRYGQAQLYNNLGHGYANIGYQPKAIENLNMALPLWRDLGIYQEEMRTRINAAKAYVEMGDLSTALTHYNDVLNYCKKELDKQNSPLKNSAIFLKPYALNGIGLVYDTWADTDEALAHYKQALELMRVNNKAGEADVLDNMGMTHAFLGDIPQALQYFNEALTIRELITHPKPWGITLSNIGYAYTLLREHEKALQQLELALPLSQRSGDRRFEANTLVRIGMAYVGMNEPRKALAYYQRALEIQQEPAFQDSRGEAITLDKMAEAHALASEWTQALSTYEKALKLWKEVRDDQGLALSLYGIAQVESLRSNLANARDRVEEAINIVERLRSKVSGRQLQMIYFADKQDFYKLAIDVRMRLYKSDNSSLDLEMALAISERARARNLNDLLAETRAEPQKVMSHEDAEKDRRLDHQISELTQNLLRQRSLGHRDVALVETTLTARMKEQDELRTRSKQANRPINRAEQSLPLTPSQIQNLLDDNTLLLEYSLGPERSYLWIVSPTNIDHYTLAARAEIEASARQLRHLLSGYEPQRDGESITQTLARQRQTEEQYPGQARALSKLILEPVWSKLGGKRLVIIADGTLQYIPFELLPTPQSSNSNPQAGPGSERTLVLTNEVVYQPSASTLALLRGSRRRLNPKTVAVIADPVFHNTDSRVRRLRGQSVNRSANPARETLSRSLRDIGDSGAADYTLEQLQYSSTEANAITAAAPRGSWMKAVGFKANRAVATSPTLRQFGIVHFATHGIVNDVHPELSGIVLSMVNERGQPQDGFLTLRDIYQLDLPVQLVVVSACQTGVGRDIRGEGLIGLTRGFMYAGAQRVVVSLWRVDDEATAELMKRFYTHMLGKNKLPAATALWRAKLEMMQHEEWQAPYYWAGFVLQGDWK